MGRRMIRASLGLLLGPVLLGAKCSEPPAPPRWPDRPLTFKDIPDSGPLIPMSISRDAGAPPDGHWEAQAIPQPFLRVNSIWGASATDLWALGEERLQTEVFHCDGHRWTPAQAFEGRGSGVLRGRAPDDLWIVGSYARRSTPDAGFVQAIDALKQHRDLMQLTAGPTGTLWAVGEHGLVMHQEKPSDPWEAEEQGPVVPAFEGRHAHPTHKGDAPHGTTHPALAGVWAGARDEVLAVGEDGTLLHRQDGTWEQEPTGTVQPLHAVWASGRGDAWAVGEGDTVLRKLGQQWQPVELPVQRVDYYAVWGAGSGDLYLAGTRGTLLHWDGVKFTVVPTATKETLLDIWGDGAGQVWVVGDNATVLHKLPK